MQRLLVTAVRADVDTENDEDDDDDDDEDDGLVAVSGLASARNRHRLHPSKTVDEEDEEEDGNEESDFPPATAAAASAASSAATATAVAVNGSNAAGQPIPRTRLDVVRRHGGMSVGLTALEHRDGDLTTAIVPRGRLAMSTVVGNTAAGNGSGEGGALQAPAVECGPDQELQTITVNTPDYPEFEELRVMMQDVQASDAVTLHPVLNMPTSARGTNLSGGFAQSVALARIFLKPQSRIVILDESLGQMDAVKKRDFILPRLFAFVRRHQMALLLIAHDMAVMRDVDHIFVLEEGRLAAQGHHDELMAQQAPAYMKLVS